ncbi:MAG TPA: type II toxin-antitoxin system VapC family toxin [Pirellulales bacterium]|nr:type II toxin-antitoxin system VapC family toxin [Pirellulales bacterium]
MNLSLDTHVLLWWLDKPGQLSTAVRRALRDPHNTVYVSAAVAWEIAIKQTLGKNSTPQTTSKRPLRPTVSCRCQLPSPMPWRSARYRRITAIRSIAC